MYKWIDKKVINIQQSNLKEEPMDAYELSEFLMSHRKKEIV